MLTRWLTFTAFLAASASPGRAAIGRSALTVAPTCRVKGHRGAELTLHCGDGESAGVVQYWHTPFGELHPPSDPGDPGDPVFVHHDGTLVASNPSVLHSGLYYCVLQQAEGSTLWPYELHVSSGRQQDQEHRGAFRFRRDAGPEEERRAGVSDGEFAGAVAASVLLTFVLGFSSGALSRTHVLRCLRAVGTRLRSPRQQRCHADRMDSSSEVTMTTLPPMYDSRTSEADESANAEVSTTSPPPVKPQRSFRVKEPQEEETTAYLEGCDYTGREEEEEEEGRMEEEGEEEDGELSGFYPLGEEDGGSQTEREDEGSDDGGQRREAKQERRQEEEEEQKKSSKEDREEGRMEAEEEGEEEDGELSGFYPLGDEDGGSQTETEDERREAKQEEEEEQKEDGEEEEEEGDDGETSDEDGETGHEKQEETAAGAASSPLRPGRRSRVIRLYQYDEDGQRYGHLPDPAPEDPGPAPRLRQRSVSLTRLNAIMAAASAGPLGAEREERPHFHMEI